MSLISKLGRRDGKYGIIRTMRDLSVRENVSAACAAIRANAVPMVLLWLAAVGTVAAYCLVPPFAAALEPLARWQTANGWLAAAANRVAFTALLPGAFLLTIRELRPKRPLATIFSYALWGAAWGVLCDGFFSLQQAVFGVGRDFATVAAKTLVDQFVWTPLFCTPMNVAFFTWVAGGFAPFRIGDAFRRGYGPMLIASWIVWLPVVATVYLFPLPLQVQLVGFAGAFWMLAALAAGGRKGWMEGGE